ncbi:hypothetical protein H6P81_016423 [Aristolochia fimbriata]|uniref:Uncharacterized protein n=1 Tax=Aristolochia fimbriata TaxID=158543 RepID=A0AAV7ECV3_ARIFI|nr:hypothetical protein H6P81_016423 [Aristolochia fimbriata]
MSEMKMSEREEGNEELPRDAKIVKSLLKSMGIQHAFKPAIDCEDIKLAIQTKVNCSFSQPPPRKVLLELARNRNKIPLPKSVGADGIESSGATPSSSSPIYCILLRRERLISPIHVSTSPASVDEGTTCSAVSRRAFGFPTEFFRVVCHTSYGWFLAHWPE